LKQLEVERQQARDAGFLNRCWLLKHRSELRRAIQFSQLEPIKFYLADCPPEMVHVGVWLWGKCTDRFRLYGLSAFCHHPWPQVRRCVAKALRRAEAWALLDDMAEAYPLDPKIQWFATASIAHRPFHERLQNFARNVDESHAGEVFTPSRMPFWALDRSWERTPPKSREFIRRMLWRIRHWVRWGVS
jgi:hypothetical protein